MIYQRRMIGVILAIMVVLAVAGFFYLYGIPVILSSHNVSGFAENLTIASGSPELSILTLVADEEGFFRKHDITLNFLAYPTGVESVTALLAGDADLAYAAEFVDVHMLFSSRDLRIIGCTAKGETISFVIQKDRGIISPRDLRGKTIAVLKGTQAEFFLGRFLTLNGIPLSDVTIQYPAPADLVPNIVSGSSDAGIIWEPYVFDISLEHGNKTFTWPAQSGQLFYWTIVTRPEVLDEKSALLTRYFRALAEAEEYIYAHEGEAKAGIKKRLNLSDEYLDLTWNKTRFVLSLDQSLIIAMEDEARWIMKNNLTNTTVMPVYLDYIDSDILMSVKPQSVTLIR